MRTILIAHRDVAFAEQLAGELRASAIASSPALGRGHPRSAAFPATRAIAH